MLLALYLIAVLSTVAATARAVPRFAFLGVAGGVATLAAFAAGAFLDAPSPARGACWVYGIALLGKVLALGRSPVGGGIGVGRGLAYLFLWPGLYARRAYVPDPTVDRRAGLASAGLGALEVVAGLLLSSLAASRGWFEMGSFPSAWVRLFAFGSFLDGGFRGLEGVLAGLGYRPERIFRRPWAAGDPADFWANRWNRFVGRTLALEVYAPAKRRVGRLAALLATFLASGVLHEALFRGSTPGPVGRYLAFFLLHGLAVAASARGPAPTRRGRIVRRALSWAFLLATAPLFFGGCYPAVVPLELVLGR